MQHAHRLELPLALPQWHPIDPDWPPVPEAPWDLPQINQWRPGLHDLRYLDQLPGRRDQAPKVQWPHQRGAYRSARH